MKSSLTKSEGYEDFYVPDYDSEGNQVDIEDDTEVPEEESRPEELLFQKFYCI